MTPITVHVGFGKCASTFLQHYFDAHPGVERIPRQPALQHFMANNDLAFDPAPGRAAFREMIGAISARGRHPVFSSERLTGNVLTGHYDMGALAQRIAAIFDAPRIVLMIREQNDLIGSIYGQYVRAGGTASLAAFVRPEWDGRVPLFDPQSYAFDRLIDHYHTTFGAANVLVIPLELLRADRTAVLRRLCAFCGIDDHPADDAPPANAAIPVHALGVKRRLNYLTRPWVPSYWDRMPLRFDHAHPLVRFVLRRAARRTPRRTPPPLRDAVRTLLPDHFGASNARTAARLDLDLAAYGYDVTPPVPSSGAPRSMEVSHVSDDATAALLHARNGSPAPAPGVAAPGAAARRDS